MSVAKVTESEQTPTAIPTVEYSAAVVRQTSVDAELAAVRFTGVTQDAVTGDWICWREGQIIGWAKTPGEAGQRVTGCSTACAEHSGTMSAEQAVSILADAGNLTGVEAALLTLV